MKIAITTLLIILSSISHAQKVEIQAIRLHALLAFTFSNAGARTYSPFLKTYTEKSEYAEKVKSILTEFPEIEKSLDVAVNYRIHTRGYGEGFSVEELFNVQSGYATSIDDLFIRLQNTMPMGDLLKFKKMVKELDPIYEKLIWSKLSSNLKKSQDLYQEKLEDWNVNQLFSKAKVFYNSDWPIEQNF